MPSPADLSVPLTARIACDDQSSRSGRPGPRVRPRFWNGIPSERLAAWARWALTRKLDARDSTAMRCGCRVTETSARRS
jgi:hypothetical protein